MIQFMLSYCRLIATTMSAYRGQPNVSDFALAGGITGACYRLNLGPKGMLVGGVLGLFISFVFLHLVHYVVIDIILFNSIG